MKVTPTSLQDPLGEGGWTGLLQTRFALCEQRVVKQSQDVPLTAPLGAHGGAGLFPQQGCRFATRAEQEAV